MSEWFIIGILFLFGLFNSLFFYLGYRVPNEAPLVDFNKYEAFESEDTPDLEEEHERAMEKYENVDAY